MVNNNAVNTSDKLAKNTAKNLLTYCCSQRSD